MVKHFHVKIRSSLKVILIPFLQFILSENWIESCLLNSSVYISLCSTIKVCLYSSIKGARPVVMMVTRGKKILVIFFFFAFIFILPTLFETVYCCLPIFYQNIKPSMWRAFVNHCARGQIPSSSFLLLLMEWSCVDYGLKWEYQRHLGGSVG